jgi:hypothetical protein
MLYSITAYYLRINFDFDFIKRDCLDLKHPKIMICFNQKIHLKLVFDLKIMMRIAVCQRDLEEQLIPTFTRKEKEQLPSLVQINSKVIVIQCFVV